MRLYGVNPRECFVVREEDMRLGGVPPIGFSQEAWDTLIKLRPRMSGDYSLPD